MRERERERVCVCVCVCEREREREIVCVCVCARACMYMCTPARSPVFVTLLFVKGSGDSAVSTGFR